MNRCNQCAGSGQLSACGGCRSVLYCDRACQKLDWTGGGHSRVCGVRLPVDAAHPATPYQTGVSRVSAQRDLQRAPDNRIGRSVDGRLDQSVVTSQAKKRFAEIDFRSITAIANNQYSRHPGYTDVEAITEWVNVGARAKIMAPDLRVAFWYRRGTVGYESEQLERDPAFPTLDSWDFVLDKGGVLSMAPTHPDSPVISGDIKSITEQVLDRIRVRMTEEYNSAVAYLLAYNPKFRIKLEATSVPRVGPEKTLVDFMPGQGKPKRYLYFSTFVQDKNLANTPRESRDLIERKKRERDEERRARIRRGD